MWLAARVVHAAWRVCQKFTTRSAVDGIRRMKFTARFSMSAGDGTRFGPSRSRIRARTVAHSRPIVLPTIRIGSWRSPADQAVEGRDLHARHRRQRGDRFLVFVGLGKAEQRAFVQFARAVQRQDRALRRREVAAALDLLGHAGNLAHRLLDRRLPAGLDHLEQAAADDIDRSRQQILQLRRGEIVALADRQRQNAVVAGALDQRRISGLRESAPALPAARRTTSRSPRRTMTSVRPGESVGRSDIASR